MQNRPLLFLTIILALSWLFLYPLVLYLFWFRWKKRQDPQNKYDCLSIAKLAYYQYNYPAYLITNSVSGSFRFDSGWWALFIQSLLTSQAKGTIQPGNPFVGLLTPKTLCETLAPDDADMIYPTGKSEWRKLLSQWAGLGGSLPTVANYKPNQSTWQSAQGNFLRDWGVTPDSPMVLAFITNASTMPNGSLLYPEAINSLLGISGVSNVNGWFGFLKDNNFNSLVELERQVWSSEQLPRYQKAKQTHTCKPGSVITQALIQGAAFGGMAAISTAELGPVAGFSALLGLAIGTVSGLVSSHCL